MPSKLQKIATWAVLGVVLIIGVVALAVRKPAGTQTPPVVRNVMVQIDPVSVTTGATSTLSLLAVDAEGNPIDAWGGSAEGWLVRSDLTYIQHILAEGTGATSTLKLPVLPTEPGSYRLALIAKTDTNVTTGGSALRVRGISRDVPPEEQSAAREGYKVTVSTIPALDAISTGDSVNFTYSVERTDTQVPLDDYRGTRGSLIAFKDGGGLFILGDAMPSELLPSKSAATFSVAFPEGGRYRVFFEFQVNGKRYVEARWVDVASE